MKFDNTYFLLPERFYAKASPARFSKPKLLTFNHDLATELDCADLSDEEIVAYFSGQKILKGSHPIALAYAGHQFGHFVPQLGDGRAVLLGEVVTKQKMRYDLQLKGAGRTPFSRNGDGFSAIGPVIREYIVSEAMHHLGVPTTRALAAVATGDLVYREEPVPGAVFTRVAQSHIRIGTFQYFAAREDVEGLKILLDYCVRRHYPEIESDLAQPRAILFLKKVIAAQIKLVAQWMSLGFIHGVMNTDNISISGQTIDYGPCAFMDVFTYQKKFSYIDQNGRYAYMNQGNIIAWNLARLADCLVPLVDSDEDKAVNLLTQVLEPIHDQFSKEFSLRMLPKLGFAPDEATPDQVMLVKSWLDILEKEKLDFTLSFRSLAELLENKEGTYLQATHALSDWITSWKKSLEGTDTGKIVERMNKVNPLYIPRNHQVERAIARAIEGDLTVFHELNEVLKNPYRRQPAFDRYQKPPLPAEEIHRTFCGT